MTDHRDPATNPKVLVSWSSGKDSAWMLHVLKTTMPGAAQALLTTINDAFDRVAMHGVRRTILHAQAQAAGLPLRVVPLPWPCSNQQYERQLGAAIDAAIADGFTHVAFGDLFLEDVRRYREDQLAGTGLTPMFPLWGLPTSELADQMIRGGLRAYVSTVDPRCLPPSFAGRAFDRRLLDDLPPEVDPCGERGEFHTCAWNGPMFDQPLSLDVGDTVERDGFVFADLTLTNRPTAL